MQFTTRCPACGTIFKVVTDQLKISDGWVRCGDCSHVFDASLQVQVQEQEPPLPAPAPVSAPVAAPVAEPDKPPRPGREAGQPEPAFVRQAKRRARWRTPGVRAALGLVSVMLALLLLVQWSLHHRDRLAASEPALQPWLVKACEALGCDIAPVRRIEAIAIDSTTLVHRLDNFYAFDIVLRNQATHALAVPALELTLTRADDSVLARRVFLAHELPGVPGLLPARSAVALNLRLSLALGDGVSMAGYSARVFYP